MRIRNSGTDTMKIHTTAQTQQFRHSGTRVMKYCLVVIPFLMTAKATAFSDNVNNEVIGLNKPYAITHLNHLGIDCVWTRAEQGYLQSEATGPDGPGACWDSKSVDQATRLDKAKKLVWNPPPVFDYEYGDESKCYYRIDKVNGFIDLLLGDVTDAEASECRKDSSKEKALKLAVKVEKKVDIGGYIATKENILGSVLLACYTGSLDSDDRIVSNNERVRRFTELLDLYKDDNAGRIRVANAFDFADRNLRDRYPLDTEGRYRTVVCEQMVKKGKL